MSLDLLRARRETPGCENVIHFNNAGAALMPQPVLDALFSHLRLESEIGGYEAGDRAAEQVNRIYEAAGQLIGCGSDEIAVVESATKAWDLAFYAIPFEPGDRILTSRWEYASNFIAYLQVARRTGAVIEVIPNDETGAISLEALAQAAAKHVKLISLTHVPTNCGIINPAEEVGAIARHAGALYLLDACQSVGQIPLDLKTLGCHMLCATGRKFLRGPRGTGFLYVSNDILDHLDPPFLDLHAARWVEPDRYELAPDARRFESWETNYAAKIGLGVAVDYALQWGVETTAQRTIALAQRLRKRLDELSSIDLTDRGTKMCGIVSFTVRGMHPAAVRKELSHRGINVSVSPPEYTLLDMTERGLTDGVIRASVHYYNTEDEIDQFQAELRQIAS